MFVFGVFLAGFRNSAVYLPPHLLTVAALESWDFAVSVRVCMIISFQFSSFIREQETGGFPELAGQSA